MKICVYAITKNEEAFVDRWVDSMREADEICVLDTGSTDRTVERLLGRGVKVEVKRFESWDTIGQYEEIVARGGSPWRFDVARNDSMRICPHDADLLVCTDLDEILVRGWREKLERCWTDAVERGDDPTTATYEYVWNFQPDGKDGCKFTYEKVHRPWVCEWTHPVHEVLKYPGGRRTVNVPGMRLEHHADPTKSRGQYLKLLELSVWECPEDDRNAHYLGREYMFHGMWDRSIEQLQRHLSMPTAKWKAERAASMRYIARAYEEKGSPGKALAWLVRAVGEDPTQREAAMEMSDLGYRMASRGGDDAKMWWGVCADGARKALAVTERSGSYLSKSENWGWRPYDLMSIGLWYSGDAEGARQAVVRALEYRSDMDRRTFERIENNARLMGVAS